MAVVAAVIVGGTLLASGVLKLSRPAVWNLAAAGMGVPRPLAAGVPAGEVVVGALLAAQLWRSVLGWVAAVMLAAFTVLLIVRLARGQRPPCACFGSATKRISWWDVGRNTVLIAVAILAAAG